MPSMSPAGSVKQFQNIYRLASTTCKIPYADNVIIVTILSSISKLSYPVLFPFPTNRGTQIRVLCDWVDKVIGLSSG